MTWLEILIALLLDVVPGLFVARLLVRRYECDRDAAIVIMIFWPIALACLGAYLAGRAVQQFASKP